MSRRALRAPSNRRSVFPSRLGLWAACFGLCFAVVGCGEPAATTDASASHLQRFIDEEAAICDAGTLRRPLEAMRWRAGERGSPWKAPRARREAEGLRPRLASGRVRMAAEVDFEASEVQDLEVVLSELTGGHLRLYWAREGEEIDDQRYLRRRMVGHHEKRRTLQFPVAEHPEWSGRIVRLRLDVYSLNNESLLLEQVVAYRREPVDDFARRIEQPCKVDLAGDFRAAYYALPEEPLSRRVQVGQDHVLRFAYGMDAAVRAPVDFEVRIGEDVIFQDRLEPLTGEQQAGWREAQVALGEFLSNGAGAAARSAELTFSVSSPQELDPALGLPAWGHPEVILPDDEAPWNVLLISIDTLRADRLSLSGYDRETTPHIDAWAAQAAIFDAAIAQAPWTLPAHVSMFSGLDTVRHGVNHSRAPDGREELSLLAERLRAAGWTTGAATGGAFLHPSYGLAQGFDAYRSWTNRAQDADELSSGVDAALAWFDARPEEPSLFLLHTYAVHDPFEAHLPFYEEFGGDPAEVEGVKVGLKSPTPTPEHAFRHAPEYVLRRGVEEEPVDTEEEFALVGDFYDSGVAAMDAEIGRLFQELEQRGVLRRTLVILTSDHGEAFGETPSRVSHVQLHDSVLKVPLIIAAPDGQGRGARIADQVRSTDLVPTVLDFLGLLDAEKAASFDGVSLRPLMNGDASAPPPADAWSYAPSGNRGLALRRNDRLKYIFNNTAWASREGQEAPSLREIYDVRRDPLEHDDLTEEFAEIEGLHRTAAEYFDRVAPGARLRILNAEDDVLRGEILSPLVQGNNVKSLDMFCECLRWIEDGRAAFEAPPGESFTLVFEKPVADTITVRGTLGEASFDHRFTLKPNEASALRWHEAGWIAESSAETKESVETGFVVWSRGASSGKLVEPDAELLEQLEALGYL